MSGSTNFTSSSIAADPAIRPTHHVHSSNDPLPGAKGVGAVDYSAETMERTPSTWDTSTEQKFTKEHDATLGNSEPFDAGSQQSSQITGDDDLLAGSTGSNVVGGDTHGTSIAGDEQSWTGKVSMMDKIVGKTQKVSYARVFLFLS